MRSRGGKDGLPEASELDLAEPVSAGAEDGVRVRVELFVEDQAEVSGDQLDALVAKVASDGRCGDAEECDGVGEKVGDARVRVLGGDPRLLDGGGVVEEGGAHAGSLLWGDGGEGGVCGERAGRGCGEALAGADARRAAALLVEGAAAVVGGHAGDVWVCGDRDAGDVWLWGPGGGGPRGLADEERGGGHGCAGLAAGARACYSATDGRIRFAFSSRDRGSEIDGD